MSDDTRKLLKLFGVAVTDFETEAERIAAAPAGGKDEALGLVKDAAELCREVNRRWLEVTNHLFASQDRFLLAIGEAATRARS